MRLTRRMRARSTCLGRGASDAGNQSHEERTARHWMVVPYPIPRRCTATYFPEGNALVPVRSVAHRSNTPTSKSVRITIARAESPAMVGTS